MPDASTSRTGTFVGPYRLEREIGRGGMGVVYEARRGGDGEIVAVKLMLPEIAANPVFRARFVREATTAPRIDHPNVVPVFDAGDHGGELYIAMRLVEGRDLKQIIVDEGRLALDRIVSVFRQIASALDAAHEAGVVHRDVKPQNVLVERDPGAERDVVYITDFGLVKPAGTESTASRTGAVFGSIQYISPEAIEGHPVDGRADVYSLGCLLYECLTGKIPFERANEIAVLWAHINEAPPRATAARPGLPSGVDPVVATALAKHPDDRYLTCGELVAALEAGLASRRLPMAMPLVRPLVERVARPKDERDVWSPNFFPELRRVQKASAKQSWLRTIAVVALPFVVAGTLQLAHPRGVVGAAQDVAAGVGDAGAALRRILPAEDAPPSAASDDPVRPSSAEPSTGPAQARSAVRRSRAPSTSPSSPTASGEVLPPATRDAQEEAGVSDPTGPARIAWVTADSDGAHGDIWVMDAAGGNKVQLTAGDAAEAWPDWSPDGRRIVFVRDWNIWVMDSDGSRQRNLGLCPGLFRCAEPAWSPTGRHIAYIYGSKVYVMDVKTGRRRVVPALWGKANWGSNPAPSWSPDGRRLIGACPQTSGVCRVDLASGRQTVLIPPDDRPRASFAWSPHGTYVAMEVSRRVPGCNACPEIYVFRQDGSDARVVTTTTIGAFDPTWSSDQRRLAFSYWMDSLGDIVSTTLDGGNMVRLTNSPTVSDVQPDWWGPSP